MFAFVTLSNLCGIRTQVVNCYSGVRGGVFSWQGRKNPKNETSASRRMRRPPSILFILLLYIGDQVRFRFKKSDTYISGTQTGRCRPDCAVSVYSNWFAFYRRPYRACPNVRLASDPLTNVILDHGIHVVVYRISIYHG